MKIYQLFFLLLLIFFTPHHASAFDKIYCQSDLKGWVITLTDSTQTVVLTPYSQNVTLPEKMSQKLILKDSNTDTVISIFPWNTLYIRIPDKTKKVYKVNSKESEDGFFIEIINKVSNDSRSLNCRFTF